MIENVVDDKAPTRFSPIFDTARGLFWNESEAKLADAERSGRRERIER